MKRENTWSKYQEKTKDNKPRELATALSKHLKAGMSIVDIGCGAGTDSLYFLEHGCSIISIDNVTDSIEKKKLDLSEDLKNKLTILNADFTNITLPSCNVLYASFSLPFCNSDDFKKLWSNIEQALDNNGIFAGVFFGLNDDWAQRLTHLTFHERNELEEMFKKYDTKLFNEKEFEGTCLNEDAEVVNKHWHIYEIIAIKKSLA